MAKKKSEDKVIRINNSVFYITKEDENYYIDVQDELKYDNRVPICKKAYDELEKFELERQRLAKKHKFKGAKDVN